MSKIARMMALHGLSLENDDVVVDETARTAGTDGGEGGERTAEPVVVEVEPLSSEDTEAGAAAETEEAAQEVTEVAEVVEELEEAHEGLESLYLDVITARKAGGLSAQAARGYTHAIHAYTGRFGMATPAVSNEAFGGATSRMHATISLEADIGQKLRDMLNTAIEALKSLWRNVVAFMKKLWDGSTRVQKRAETLLAAADKMTGTPKETTVKLPASLAIAGKAPSDLSAAMTAVAEQGKGMLVFTPPLMAGLSNSTIEALKSLKYDEGKLAEGIAALCKTVSAKADKIPGELKLTKADDDAAKRFGDDVAVWASDELLGGKGMFAVTPVGESPTPKTIGQIRVGIQAFTTAEVAVEKDLKINTLDKEGVVTIANSVIETCKLVTAKHGAYDGFMRTIDQLKAAGNDVAKNLAKDEKLTAEDKAAANALVMASIGLMQRAGAGVSASTGYLMNTSRAVLDVCAASAKAYGAAPAAAKEDKKDEPAAK